MYNERNFHCLRWLHVLVLGVGETKTRVLIPGIRSCSDIQIEFNLVNEIFILEMCQRQHCRLPFRGATERFLAWFVSICCCSLGYGPTLLRYLRPPPFYGFRFVHWPPNEHLFRRLPLCLCTMPNRRRPDIDKRYMAQTLGISVLLHGTEAYARA